MKSLPRKCLLDTNVPKTANLAVAPAKIPEELISCVSACVEAVEHVVRRGGLVWMPAMRSLTSTGASFGWRVDPAWEIGS